MEWFAGHDDHNGGRTHAGPELLCELPPKPTQRVADARQGRAQPSQQPSVHDDDLHTFPALCKGESAESKRQRLIALRQATTHLRTVFGEFRQERDSDDFHRLWTVYLSHHSPQRLLPPAQQHQQADAGAAAAAPPPRLAIPTLLLSTNGASPADRLDLYGAFAAYLRQHQDAYVAQLRPEDVGAGVGSCFGSLLRQMSGTPEAATAEDVAALLEWYEHETGRSARGAGGTGQQEGGRRPLAVAATPAKTPAGKTPGGGKGKARGGAGRGGAAAAAEVGKENTAAEGGGAGDDGTVAARLRNRRGGAAAGPQAGGAAAGVEERAAREAAAAARNAVRHVVVLVEGADRITDRGALRALLAALHAERHRLPLVLVLGLSSPAPLYASKLPPDMAGMLATTCAELSHHHQQLHRLFDRVLLSHAHLRPGGAGAAAAGGALLLLDGAAMRQLLLQSRLLEPSLAGIEAALQEAHEQHFRREPLAALALLPLQGAPARAGGRASASSSSDSSSSSSGGDSDGEDGSQGAAGPLAPGAVDEAWLQQRRAQHAAALRAAVAGQAEPLVRGAAKAIAEGGAAARSLAQAQAVVVDAVTDAAATLSAWRLGVLWLASLAERTGASKQASGARYSLPSLYVAAASPAFWRLTRSAAAGPTAGASVAESLIAGVLGCSVGLGGGSGGSSSRGTVRALPPQELGVLLDALGELTHAALTEAWMPHPALLRAAKGLQDLQPSQNAEEAAEADAQGPDAQQDGGDAEEEQAQGEEQGEAQAAAAAPSAAAAPDLLSPVRQRLAAQQLVSPPTEKKVQAMAERMEMLQAVPPCRLEQGGKKNVKPSLQRKAGVAGALAAPTAVRLPPSGQTQNKRQREQALHAAVQQRAAAGPAAAATEQGGAAAGGSRGAAAARPAGAVPWADRCAAFLEDMLHELLGTCPFTLPGAGAFTFRDAAALQGRLIGAPSLALHTALTSPEVFLPGLQPGLHGGQEDAAIAYQLLVGCREGADLREWLAEFCAASGLGRLRVEEAVEEAEEEEAANADGPLGRSRTSKRRHAPRKRKPPPKQEVVLDLEGPGAEAAVDALACRFEQAARELEAVGLCRFTKRRKGTFVQRTYFPPEHVA